MKKLSFIAVAGLLIAGASCAESNHYLKPTIPAKHEQEFVLAQPNFLNLPKNEQDYVRSRTMEHSLIQAGFMYVKRANILFNNYNKDVNYFKSKERSCDEAKKCILYNEEYNYYYNKAGEMGHQGNVIISHLLVYVRMYERIYEHDWQVSHIEKK